MSHSYQTWFTWLSGNWCLCVWVAWPCDHEVRIRIIWYQILAPLIRLYPSEIFISCCFRKNSLVSNFFFSLNLRHIKNKLLFHYVIVQNISVASKTKTKKEKSKKKIVQKDVYWIMPLKTKQEKIGSNQLGISSNLIL